MFYVHSFQLGTPDTPWSSVEPFVRNKYIYIFFVKSYKTHSSTRDRSIIPGTQLTNMSFDEILYLKSWLLFLIFNTGVYVHDFLFRWQVSQLLFVLITGTVIFPLQAIWLNPHHDIRRIWVLYYNVVVSAAGKRLGGSAVRYHATGDDNFLARLSRNLLQHLVPGMCFFIGYYFLVWACFCCVFRTRYVRTSFCSRIFSITCDYFFR